MLILTKRLTEKQKEEIVKSFKSGTNIDILSQKYTCTNSTIIRNLKKNLGDLKFKEFLKKSKSFKGKSKTNKSQTYDLPETKLDNADSKKYSDERDVFTEKIIDANINQNDYFFEIEK